jgi:hypothetical protein
MKVLLGSFIILLCLLEITLYTYIPETGTGGGGFVVRDLDGEVMQRLEELTVWWMRYKQKWWHAQPP